MKPDGLITGKSAGAGIAKLMREARQRNQQLALVIDGEPLAPDIKHAAQFSPGSVSPAAKIVRRRSSTSPTQRTLAYLRKLGWQVAVTEHWQAIPNHPAGGVRKDLWGFGDMMAISPQGAHVIVQCTASAVTARCKKIDAIPEAGRWLRSEGDILVIGWRKLKPRGTKVPHWNPRILFAALDETGAYIRWSETEVSR